MSTITVDKQGQVGQGKFQYATFANIMRVARPVLTKADIFVTQSVTSSPLGRSYQRITTMAIGHGARFSTALDYAPKSFLDDNPHGSIGQRLGNCWGYLRRMCLQNLFMLSPDRDDGEVEEAPPSRKQATPKASKPARAGRSSRPDANPPAGHHQAPVARPQVAVPQVATVKVPNPASRVPASEPEPSHHPEDAAQPVEESGYAVQNPEPEPSPTQTPAPTNAEPALEEETVTPITKPQRQVLRGLFLACGLKQRSEVEDYIKGLLGETWKATNLTAQRAGMLITALKELAESKKAAAAVLEHPEGEAVDG